jgi:hypothetical protein
MAEPTQDQAQEATDSGAHYAAWDKDLEQYVSGVGSKSDADKARKALGETGITAGHKLVTRKL